MKESDLGSAYLSETQVRKLVEAMEDGQPFTVVFTKKNGDERKMLCSVDSTKKEGDTYVGSQIVWDREANRVKAFRDAFVISITVP